MIAFRDDLPLIEMDNRQTVAFDCDWLARALNLSAHRCGHAEWWLAPHVAESVRTWLGTLDDVRVLPVAHLMRAVRTALQAVGYADVGERFEEAAPFTRISLVELAQEAGQNFELGFFAALGRRLQEVLGLGSSYCELHGLERCVKLLRKRKIWCRDCASLQAEIVSFARDHTGTERAPSELFLFVA